MKISKIEIILLRKQLSSTMRISRGGFTERFHTLVRVHTDEGYTGLGEGVGNAHAIFGILEHYTCKKALGLDPTNIDAIRSSLIDSHVYFERKGSAICAASAIEMACWDILGKSKDLPVYKLISSEYRPELETYVSDIYLDTPNAMSEYARLCLDKGFQNFKIHIGSDDLSEDSKRIEKIRKLIGSNGKLMVDLNAGYTPDKAFKAVHEWADFNLFWLEEPLNPNLINELAELKTKTKIPIAAGENEFLLFGFKELIEKKAIDFAMPDIGRAGGIWESHLIAQLAQRNGLLVSPHNFSSGVLLAATLHLVASTPGASLIEIDASSNSIYDELLDFKLEFATNTVKVPNLPGLGVSLKQKTLDSFCSGLSEVSLPSQH